MFELWILIFIVWLIWSPEKRATEFGIWLAQVHRSYELQRKYVDEKESE